MKRDDTSPNGRRIDEKAILSDPEERADGAHFACPTYNLELDPGPHRSWVCWHCQDWIAVRGGSA